MQGPRTVRTDLLVDARAIGDALGVNRQTVYNWRTRRPDMPAPVVDMGEGRAVLWLWPEVVEWYAYRMRPKVDA